MITIPFRGAGWPWRLGAPEVSPPVLFTVALDGRSYQVDMEQYRHASLETLRDQVAIATEASDALFNAQGSWTRYKYSWHRGADQEDADLDRDADAFRFDVSEGVNNWERGRLELNPSMSLSRAAESSNPMLQRSNNYLFLADGTSLYRTSDLTTWTACTGLAGTINSMTSDGKDLYVATTSNVYRFSDSATSGSSFVTGSTDSVGFVANLLLVGKSEVLANVATGGTTSTIKTHFQTDFVWNVLFAIGSRVYVGGSAGDRSELYTLVTDDTGAPVLSAEAAPLPAGETLNVGYSYAGAALLGTSKGVRFAQVGGDGTLTYGPLIDAVGDVRAIVANGRFAFCSWSANAGVAQLALDTAVRALQPAYSAGPQAPSSVSGAVTGVATLNDRLVIAVANSGVYAEDTALYEQLGTLDSGLVYFGTVEDKVLTQLQLTTEPLAFGESVTAEVYDEFDTLLAQGALTRAGESKLTLELGGRSVSAFYVRLILGAGRAG
jgi:hypothetical protein